MNSLLSRSRVAVVLFASICFTAGCNVYRVSPDYVANRTNYFPRSEMMKLNFLQLRQDPPQAYLLGPKDVLGIYIEGIIGDEQTAPPVTIPDDQTQSPAIGYPIPVRDDGRISLPMVDPLYVSGLTIGEAEEKIRGAYVDAGILKQERARIIATLMRRRRYDILVVREDTATITGGGGGLISSSKKGATQSVKLPAYENDVLHALAETGGMPGEDAKNEIIVLSGSFADVQADPFLLDNLLKMDESGTLPAGANVTRIPIRYAPNDPMPQIQQSDIILHDGDVVLIRNRDTEVFYTGGLLAGGQHAIPRDYDIDVVEAIAIAGGSLSMSSGGQSGTLFSGYGGYGGGGGGGGQLLPATRARILRTVNGQPVQIDVNLGKAMKRNDPTQRVIIQPGDIVVLEFRTHEVVVNSIWSLLNYASFGFIGFSR